MRAHVPGGSGSGITHRHSVVAKEASEAAAAVLQGEGLPVGGVGGGLAGVEAVVAGCRQRGDSGSRAGARGLPWLSGLCSCPVASAYPATRHGGASPGSQHPKARGMGQPWPPTYRLWGALGLPSPRGLVAQIHLCLPSRSPGTQGVPVNDSPGPPAFSSSHQVKKLAIPRP